MSPNPIGFNFFGLSAASIPEQNLQESPSPGFNVSFIPISSFIKRSVGILQYFIQASSPKCFLKPHSLTSCVFPVLSVLSYMMSQSTIHLIARFAVSWNMMRLKKGHNRFKHRKKQTPAGVKNPRNTRRALLYKSSPPYESPRHSIYFWNSRI